MTKTKLSFAVAFAAQIAVATIPVIGKLFVLPRSSVQYRIAMTPIITHTDGFVVICFLSRIIHQCWLLWKDWSMLLELRSMPESGSALPPLLLLWTCKYNLFCMMVIFRIGVELG